MSETAKRIISGVSLAAIVVGALNYDGFGFILAYLLVLLFGMLGLYEFFILTDRGLEGRPFRLTGYFFGFLIILVYYAQFLKIKAKTVILPEVHAGLVAALAPGDLNLVPGLLFGLLIWSGILQVIYRPLDGAIYNMSVTVLGVLYACLGIGHALMLYALPAGMFYLVLFALIPISSDTGAYFAGRWFGRHNAGFKVSPKKTYEGYVGGIIFAVIIGNAFLYGWQEWGWSDSRHSIPLGHVEMSLLSFVMAFLAIFGDLVESAFKRDARIKDSASTIPGHGGVLDLADAMFFCFPAGFYYLTLRSLSGFALN